MKKKFILPIAIATLLGINTTFASVQNNAVFAAEENATQDVKNLKDGEYSVNANINNFSDPSRRSMADGAIDHKVKIVVNNGVYTAYLTFMPLNMMGQKGYLGNLETSKENSSNFTEATIVKFFSESEKDNFFDVYKAKFPNRTAYPKQFSFELNKNNINNNKLENYIKVFVPAMENIAAGTGTQKAILDLDFNTLHVEKIYHPASNPNPQRDLVVNNDKNIKANNNDEKAKDEQNKNVTANDEKAKENNKNKKNKLPNTGLATESYDYVGYSLIGISFILIALGIYSRKSRKN